MRRKWTWKRTLGVILLAAVCIGGSELVACRFADPSLYTRMISPVRQQAADMWKGAQTLAGNVWDQASDLMDTGADGDSLDTDSPSSEAMISGDVLSMGTSSLTTLTERNGMEILTGGSREIVYFNQADPAWCDQPYGKDTLGKYGCGPTTLAMVLCSLNNLNTNPEQTAQWANKNGYWAKHGGSYLSIINGAAKDYDITVESDPDCDVQHLQLELSSGKLAVALMKAGHFTSGGHFLLLRGVTLDGGILVADSNSRERSLTVWDAQLILDELSSSRSNGAPLWFLSLPAEN